MGNNTTNQLEETVKDIIRAWDKGDQSDMDELITKAETMVLGHNRTLYGEA